MASIISRVGAGLLRQSGGVCSLVAVGQKRCLPVCTIDTNLTPDKIPDTFSTEMSGLLATSLNKPEKLISVVIRPDLHILRNKNTEPSAFVQIWSVAVFDEERNKDYAVKYMEFLVSSLNMPPERIAIMFHPIERHSAAHLLYADHLESKKK